MLGSAMRAASSEPDGVLRYQVGPASRPSPGSASSSSAHLPASAPRLGSAATPRGRGEAVPGHQGALGEAGHRAGTASGWVTLGRTRALADRRRIPCDLRSPGASLSGGRPASGLAAVWSRNVGESVARGHPLGKQVSSLCYFWGFLEALGRWEGGWDQTLVVCPAF